MTATTLTAWVHAGDLSEGVQATHCSLFPSLELSTPAKHHPRRACKKCSCFVPLHGGCGPGGGLLAPIVGTMSLGSGVLGDRMSARPCRPCAVSCPDSAPAPAAIGNPTIGSGRESCASPSFYPDSIPIRVGTFPSMWVLSQPWGVGAWFVIIRSPSELESLVWDSCWVPG